MNKKGMSSITLVIIAVATIMTIGLIVVNNKTVSPKKQFMKALQYEATEVMQNVAEKEQVVKGINAKLKSGIQIKKTVKSTQEKFVEYLNNNMFELDFRYVPGTDHTSFSLKDDSNDINNLEIYGKTKNGQAIVNLGKYTEDKAYTYNLEGIPQFILANIKLSKANKNLALEFMFKYIDKSINKEDLLIEKKELEVDDTKVAVEKVSLKLTSKSFAETMNTFIKYMKEDRKYVTALDEILAEDVSNENDAKALLAKLELAVNEYAKNYSTITVSFAYNEEGKVVNSVIEAISTNKEISSKRICINRVKTNAQNFSITYLEDLDLVLGFNILETTDGKEYTATYRDFELQSTVTDGDYSNIPYMLTNLKNKEKMAGTISIAKIEESYQATITSVGMFAENVVNATLAVNVDMKNMQSLDNRIDTMRKEDLATFKKAYSLLKKEVLNIEE